MRKPFIYLALFGSAVVLSACGGGGAQPGAGSNAPDTMPAGQGGSSGSSKSQGTTTTSALGAQCAGGAAGTQYCIGLKYVAFQDSSGDSSAPQATAVSNISQINQIWKTCSVNFQLEAYQSVNPTTENLSANGDSDEDMNAQRAAFVDNTHFLVVSLYGTVGGGADAWTEEAGSGSPYGTILDYNVVTYIPVIAHEMGHYMGLEHVTDSTNLMYPSPYPNPTLTPDQCSTVTSTIQSEWTAMLR